MDYIYKINGIDILIEDHSDDKHREIRYEKREKLLEFYKRMLKYAELITPERSEVLTKIIDNLTEEKAQETYDYFRESQFLRMLAYASRLSDMNVARDYPEDFEEEKKKADEEIKKVADTLVSVVDATTEDELKNQETVYINGNNFIYEKGAIDLSDHVQKLHDIGEKIKGETWSIYIDEEGDLVIY